MTYEPENGVEITLSIRGLINGERLEGDATGRFDPSSNELSGSMRITETPENFVPELVSCTSLMGNVNLAFAQPKPDVLTLAQVFDGSAFGVEIDFNFIDRGGALLGQIHQRASYSAIDDGRVSGDTFLSGWNRTPGNVYFSPGYPVYLRQVELGQIEATYAQTLFYGDVEAAGETISRQRAGDESLYALVSRQYTYSGGLELAADQVAHYNLVSLTRTDIEGGRKLDYVTSVAYFPMRG